MAERRHHSPLRYRRDGLLDLPAEQVLRTAESTLLHFLGAML
jgi:hypothetical protein